MVACATGSVTCADEVGPRTFRGSNESRRRRLGAPRAGRSHAGGGRSARREALAARLCAGCHAIGKGGGTSPVAEAPPFASFAAKWPLEHLAEALAEGMVVGHGEGVRMPEFRFEPPDIDHLLAYLGTLREQ